MQLDPDQIMIDYIHKSRATSLKRGRMRAAEHEFQDLSLQDAGLEPLRQSKKSSNKL
jgi:hypothetical protein